MDDFKEIVGNADMLARARLLAGAVNKPLRFRLETFSLTAGQTEANPKKIGYPFSAVFVMEASHPTNFVYFKPDTDDSYQSSLTLRSKDIISFPNRVSGASIWWTGQSVTGVNGVSAWTITLCFIIDGEIKSGTVARIDGVVTDQYSTYVQTRTVLTAATAAAITYNGAQGAKNLFQNVTGADMWVGGPSVTNAGATRGILIANGDSMPWNNKSDLYAYSVAGGDVITITEI